MAADSIKPCGHHPDSGCTCLPPDPPEDFYWTASISAAVNAVYGDPKLRIGTGGSFADAIVPDDLAVRADALAAKVSHTVSAVYGAGSYPQAETISLGAFAELVELVRDLARAVAER